MALRSLASLSINFGLVAIPIKLYSATESAAAIRFKLMTPEGGRVRQKYVREPEPIWLPRSEPAELSEPEQAPADSAPLPASRGSMKVVNFPRLGRMPMLPPAVPASDDERVLARAALVKGYEYAKGKFVLFTDEELRAFQEGARRTIDIVAFIPEATVDPIYYDKAYLLAPDKQGGKPYSLLRRAMQDTGKCAIAKWAFKSKEYLVQIRSAAQGLVLQQLFYADEVRAFSSLRVDLVEVKEAELQLAKQLIAQISSDAYDPFAFVDEEKIRILAAVERKLAGKAVPIHAVTTAGGGKVIDLLAALRASLQPKAANQAQAASQKTPLAERKPSKRATPAVKKVARLSQKRR